MLKKVIALAVVGGAFATSASAANLLVNGSFENGLTGWVVGGTENPGPGQAPIAIITYGSTIFSDSANGEAVKADDATGNPGFDAVGTKAVYFSSDQANPQTLSQAVTLVAGRSYTFGFDLYKPANGDANPNGATFAASVGGNTFFSTTASSLPVTTWQTYSGANTFTASQTGTFSFSFTAAGATAKDFAVDRVYLAETSSIPEPASWGLMMAGFGLVGMALRRRPARIRFAV